jgi:hypothetical protein
MTLTLDRPEPSIENVQIPAVMLAQSSVPIDPHEADNGIVSVIWKNSFGEVSHLGSARILNCAKENLGSINIKFKKVEPLSE